MGIAKIISDLLPILPDEGPPLPRGLKIKWPEALEKLGPRDPEEGPPFPELFDIYWPWVTPWFLED